MSDPYPKVDDAAFTEREGVLAVAATANKARCIWRETPLRDIGIDGQLEYVTPSGYGTGRIVAVQVKTGSTYFSSETDDAISYTPSARHQNYWRDFPVPVILVLYDPERGTGFWADARTQLRDGAAIVRVPKNQPLDPNGIVRALQAVGPLPKTPIESAEVVRLMLDEIEPLSNCELTFLDLFLQGLTDAASWSLYFNMDLFAELAHAMQELHETDTGGLTISDQSYGFIDRYIAFLVAYDLARIDFEAFRRIAEKALMVGVVLAPLTARGRAVVDFIHAVDSDLPNEGRRFHAVTERPVQMMLSDLHGRAARIADLKRHLAQA